MDRGKFDGEMVRVLVPHSPHFFIRTSRLMSARGSIKRRHTATSAASVFPKALHLRWNIESTAQETLQSQFSGYGATLYHVSLALDTAHLTKIPLETWDNAQVHTLVSAFVSAKFPTVLALNKIDHPDADANIARIAKSHPPESLVLTSAISEVFLRRLAKQGFVRYVEGSEVVETREDLITDGVEDGGDLKEMDEKLKTRIENLRDMVLYRFGSTGVVQALSRAAELLGLVPIFPVRNAHAFSLNGTAADAEPGGSSNGGSGGGNPVFRDCVLVKKGTTVREVARKVIGDAPLAFVEGPGGMKVSEDEVVAAGKCDVLSFKIGR